MTGHRKWFSSLNPVDTKEYITFGDNGQGKVLGVGCVSLSAKLSLREVAFVQNLGFNLVFVSQLMKVLRLISRRVCAAFLMLRRPLFALRYLLVRFLGWTSHLFLDLLVVSLLVPLLISGSGIGGLVT
jgi:hypothetical protein